jgi:hypothetical protein
VQRVEPLGRHPQELAPRLVEHPQLGEQERERRPPGARVPSRDEPDDRLEGGEASALALQGEHLDAVDGGCVLVELAAELERVVGQLGRLVQPPVAHGQRRADVGGDVPVERLAGPLGHLADHRQLAAERRGVEGLQQQAEPEPVDLVVVVVVPDRGEQVARLVE